MKQRKELVAATIPAKTPVLKVAFFYKNNIVASFNGEQ